eukprot:contig_16238_g3926
MATVARRVLDDGEGEHFRPLSDLPAVFVVARRPRRSVCLLLSLAHGSWVVGEAWLVDSIQARAWLPYEDYMPAAFPGVLAARAARSAGKSLLKGLRVGTRGNLSMDIGDLRALLEAVGGRLGNNRDAAVVIVGKEPGGRVPALIADAAVMVNQLWLLDCIAQWQQLPHDT